MGESDDAPGIASAGLGLRFPHLFEVLNQRPAVAWFEVHAENYFGGGANLAALQRVRADYPLSVHGVALGLGSADGLDLVHLEALARLVERVEPVAVSEHLCWNRLDGQCFNDLLPLPFTEEALDLLVGRVQQVQDRLRRPLLIENLSAYTGFAADTLEEGDFLAALCQRTGCGLLLDLNNLWVSQHNLGRDARRTLDAIPGERVQELHIAGFEVLPDGLWLDTHGQAVSPEVWQLLDEALQRWGPKPVLLERDTHIPPLEVLLAEVSRAQRALDRCPRP